MTFIVGTNVNASPPPERRPTGTPHTRAKDGSLKDMVVNQFIVENELNRTDCIDPMKER